jgi:hypothetical protein
MPDARSCALLRADRIPLTGRPRAGAWAFTACSRWRPPVRSRASRRSAVLVVVSLVLGVPRLVADVRYLFVRNGLHRRAEVCMALAAPRPAAGGTAGRRINLHNDTEI